MLMMMAPSHRREVRTLIYVGPEFVTEQVNTRLAALRARASIVPRKKMAPSERLWNCPDAVFLVYVPMRMGFSSLDLAALT
jgi:hypothetical protein